MATLGDFLSPQAGQDRRKWLNETLGYYIPPELRGVVGLAAEVNPVTNMERASTSAKRVADPNLSGWDRMAAAGDTAVNMASVLAPVAGAKVAKTGADGAAAIVEALTAVGPTRGAVGDFATNESGALKVYHGSPHDFDKFSMDKIGTGEGAQAYGHGLYFAENEGIARSYRDALSGNRMQSASMRYDGGDLFDAPSGARSVLNEVYPIIEAEGSVDGAMRVLRDRAENSPLTYSRMRAQDLLTFMEQNASKVEYKPKGRMYEVQIDANPEDFLDWDAPLSAQPAKVREALGPRVDALRQAGAGLPQDPIGEALWKVAHPQGGFDKTDFSRSVPEQATERLRQAGIPGIRYLDAGSRGAGDGSRNYVVFDDKLISIVRKYGWAAAAPMLAQMGMTPEQAQAQYEAQQ